VARRRRSGGGGDGEEGGEGNDGKGEREAGERGAPAVDRRRQGAATVVDRRRRLGSDGGVGDFFVDLAVEGSDAHTAKSWNYYPRRFGVNAAGNFALTNMWATVSFHWRKGPNSPGVFFSFPAGETPLVV
jgi:hypothetical protein